MTETTGKRTLIEITDDLRALHELLTENGGDISDPAVEEAISEWFEQLDQDLHGKVDNYCALIRDFELTAAAKKEEAERLLAGSRAAERSAKNLKERLKYALEMLGLRKAGRVRTATVCNNGGETPVVIDETQAPRGEDIPEQFRRVTISIDQKAVRSALERGETVPWAALGERGTHLRIR